MARRKKLTDEDYRTAAKARYEDEGTLEFDDEPVVSLSGDGAYVQCWCWVSKEDARSN